MTALTNLDAINQIIEVAHKGDMDYQSTELAISNILKQPANEEEKELFKRVEDCLMSIEIEDIICHRLGLNTLSYKTLQTQIGENEIAKHKIHLIESILLEYFNQLDCYDFFRDICLDASPNDDEENVDPTSIHQLPGCKAILGYVLGGLRDDYEDYLHDDWGNIDEDEGPICFETYCADNSHEFWESVNDRDELQELMMVAQIQIYDFLRYHGHNPLQYWNE